MNNSNCSYCGDAILYHRLNGDGDISTLCLGCDPCDRCSQQPYRKSIRVSLHHEYGSYSVPWSCPCLEYDDSQETRQALTDTLLDTLSRVPTNSEWYGMFYKWSPTLLHHEMRVTIATLDRIPGFFDYITLQKRLTYELFVEKLSRPHSLDIALQKYKDCKSHHASDRLDSPLMLFMHKPAKRH